MARYIDADSLLEQISKKKCEVGKIRYLDGFNDGLMRVRSIISAAPTADVVPKSEVERLKRAYEGSQNTIKGLTEMIREKNKELTKLETPLELHYGEKSLNNLIAEQRADVAREIFEEIESKKMFLKDCVGNMGVVVLFKDISELKKKYTGEKEDEQIH